MAEVIRVADLYAPDRSKVLQEATQKATELRAAGKRIVSIETVEINAFWVVQIWYADESGEDPGLGDKEYWYKRFEESDKALRKIDMTIGCPCLEAKGDETMADALARYVIERYIKHELPSAQPSEVGDLHDAITLLQAAVHHDRTTVFTSVMCRALLAAIRNV